MARLFTIPEIKHLVKENTRKRLVFCEQSDIDQQIVRDHELGFEAVLTGNGDSEEHDGIIRRSRRQTPGHKRAEAPRNVRFYPIGGHKLSEH